MNLDYQLVRSKRKTTALYILPDGSLLVRAPLRISNKLIDEFIGSKQDWIKRHRARLVAKAEPINLLDLAQTRKVLYLGKEYPVQIVEHAHRYLEFDGEKFNLARVRANESIKLAETWYRQQARQLLNQRVAWYAHQYNFHPQKLRISSARTRWGSCSSKGTISFTWRLVMTPPEVIDYVVVHELVHLVVANHQKLFWNKVAEILPDYEKRRNWLKKNGRDIMEITKILEV